MNNERIRILIIDDMDILSQVKGLLDDMSGKFELRQKTKLKEGFDEVREWRPHVTLYDLRYPEMPDWRDTVKLIPIIADWTSVVVITGMNDEDGKAWIESRRAGANGFLQKEPYFDYDHRIFLWHTIFNSYLTLLQKNYQL